MGFFEGFQTVVNGTASIGNTIQGVMNTADDITINTQHDVGLDTKSVGLLVLGALGVFFVVKMFKRK